MEQNAHIYTPQDDSLQARVEAYQRVMRDFQSFTKNCSKLDANTLGETSDLDQARQIFTNSLKKAQQMVSGEDLQQAKAQGFISDAEILSFVQTHRTAEIEARRSSQQSHSHQQQI